MTGAEGSGLREAVAALAHEQWSGWMKYLFSKCEGGRGDRVYIPAALVERWTRQMTTPYDGLPEREKDSDRAEADKVLALLAPRPQEDGPSPELDLEAHAAWLDQMAIELNCGLLSDRAQGIRESLGATPKPPGAAAPERKD